MKVYVAGPLFNSLERRYLEELATALEARGYTTFLPHRDAGLVDTMNETFKTKVFQVDMDALESSDLIVALLVGTDHDSGTCAEIGYMYAKGKLIFGITDDIRWSNNFIWGLCNYGKHISSNIDECVAQVEQVLNS